MAMSPTTLQGAGLGLLAFGLFASHDVVVKFLGASYSPFQILFFSVLFSFPLVTVMLMRDAAPGTLRPLYPRWTILRTVAATVTGLTAFYAFSVLPLAIAYAILARSPLLKLHGHWPIRDPWREGLAEPGLPRVLRASESGVDLTACARGRGGLASATSGPHGAVCGASPRRSCAKSPRGDSAVLLSTPWLPNFAPNGYGPSFGPTADAGAQHGLPSHARAALVTTLCPVRAYRRSRRIAAWRPS